MIVTDLDVFTSDFNIAMLNSSRHGVVIVTGIKQREEKKERLSLFEKGVRYEKLVMRSNASKLNTAQFKLKWLRLNLCDDMIFIDRDKETCELVSKCFPKIKVILL